MEKLKMHSLNKVDENIEKIGKLFPNCLTETKNEDGEVVTAIDFDMLKQELSSVIVDRSEERYQFIFPDKKRTIIAANAPIAKTLRPSRDESVSFNETENVYIEGDNLDVLKLLQETYLNKIRLIYIDPPYNAGQDLLYKNNFEMSKEEFKNANYDLNEDGYIMSLNNDTNGRYHTDWVNMMYARIKVAKNLLSEDGCMVLAIDEHELINLVKICDEIFGERNRIGIVTVVHKPEGRNQERYFATSNEFALFYAKNQPLFDFESVVLDKEQLAEYDLQDEKGPYKLISYIAKNHGRDGYDKNLRENNPKNFYPIYVSPDCSEVTLEKKEGYYEALPITKTQERTWRYIIPSFKEMLNNGNIVGKIENGKAVIYEKYRIDKGQLIKTHWIDKRYNAMVYGTKLLDSIMETKTFDFPKSLFLLEDIVKLTTKNDSIVLDFFSGSATTAHAVFNVNQETGGHRKFIMVQLPQACDEESSAYKSGYHTIPEIGKERIRRAGVKLKKENPLTAANVDTGFRVLKLDSSNMKDVYYNPSEIEQTMLNSFSDNIKEDRTPEDLLFQVMLDLGVLLSSKIEETTIAETKVFNVADNFLIACFDNQVTDKVITEIAKKKPYYFVMRDSSMASDSVATNFEQIFATYSPDTVRKVL